MRRKLAGAPLLAALAFVGLGAAVQAADWKSETEAALRAKYKVTKTGSDRLRVTQPGTVFVLKQEGVRADLATDLTLYANKVNVENGQIAQAGGLAVAFSGGKETSRVLSAGEEMYLFDVDVNDKEVKYQLLTAKTYQVNVKGSTKEMRYKALLVFQFGKDVLPGLSADDVARVTSKVVATKEDVAAAAAEPKTVGLGQSRAEVEAVLGKPETILDLGQKVTYVYKNLRVVFVDGKVADVQ